MKEMTKAEIAGVFLRGGNCAQCVLKACEEETGFDAEETDALFACFGGGLMQGEACGAVVGALAVIGAVCGAEAPEKAMQFAAAFRERFGGLSCRELLGYDFAILEQAEKARASGKLIELCPDFVDVALKLLEEII